MSTFYANIKFEDKYCKITKVSDDPDITNGNIDGDGSIEFTADDCFKLMKSSFWIGGSVTFDENKIEAFLTKDEALGYVLSNGFDLNSPIVDDLLEYGYSRNGDDNQHFLDFILLEIHGIDNSIEEEDEGENEHGDIDEWVPYESTFNIGDIVTLNNPPKTEMKNLYCFIDGIDQRNGKLWLRSGPHTFRYDLYDVTKLE